jgi:hypothetical protein
MAASDFVTETKGTLPSSDPYKYYYIVCFSSSITVCSLLYEICLSPPKEMDAPSAIASAPRSNGNCRLNYGGT